MDESEERSIHRFEAFSDVVIGFSLAQLGVSLAIPNHPADLFTNPTWLAVFVWAFAMVCAMWWFHHRLFTQIFLPRTIPILLNFVWLAVVILCVYTAELSSKFPGDPIVWRMYFVLFALAYGILTLQYVICMRLRGDALSPEERIAATRAGTFMRLWTVPFVICSVIVFVFPFGYASGLAIDATFVVTGVASGLIGRRFRRQKVMAGT